MGTNARSIVAGLLLVAVAQGARGAAGDLDPTFGVDPVLGSGPFGPGVFVSDRQENANYDGRGLALHADGKIVIAFGGERVHRLLPHGVPDSEFGQDGSAPLGGVADVAVDAADQLYAVGSVFTQEYHYYGYLAHLDASGVPQQLHPVFDFGRFTRIVAADDGALFLGGVSLRRRTRFLLQRWVNGELDAEFGGRGTARYSRLGTVRGVEAIVPANDGRVLLVGTGWDRRLTPPAENDLTLVGYTSRGRTDRGFGIRGSVATNLASIEEAFDGAPQPDGRVVVAGTAGGWPLESQFVVLRHLADGSLDPSFGDDGVVTADFGGDAKAYAVAIQPDGRIVAAGEADEAIALARFLPDGRLDTSFGSGGLVRTDASPGGSSEALEVVIQSDGKIVVGGLACRLWTVDGAPSCYYVMAVRYLAE